MEVVNAASDRRSCGSPRPPGGSGRGGALGAVRENLPRGSPRDPQEIPEIPVPVGCEVVDCCPGCPGPPDFLEWRILVEKNARSVQIRLEGMDERALAGVKFRGNVTREGNVLTVGPGESFVTGLPNARKGSVGVGMVKVIPNTEQIRALSAPDADADEKDIAGLQCRSRDSAARRKVHRQSLPLGAAHLSRVPRPLLEDRVRLTSNTSNDTAVVLADFRRSNICRNDVIDRTMTSRASATSQTNGGCNSDVSVFSDDNRMSFQPNVNTWTNAIGDTHTVNLQSMLTAPVTVWIAMAGATPRAQNDFANANLLYNQNNVGVRFAATFNDVSGNANAVNTIGGTAGDCKTAAALGGTAFFTVGRINIYYVNGAFTGVNCGANRNISSSARPRTRIAAA